MIGEKIKCYRKKKKITQEQLAKYLGVSGQAVSKWENGMSNPEIYIIPKIAIFFGIRIEELFDFTYDENMERIENMIKSNSRISTGTFKKIEVYLQDRIKMYPRDERALTNLISLYDLFSHQCHDYASEYAHRSRI